MGTTSNFGFPYPESTDLVRDGAQAIEDLADAVDNKVATGFLYAGQIVYTTVGTTDFEKSDPLGTGDIGLRAVRVKVQAGGGGGGGAGSNDSAGGGGGGGAYSEAFIAASTLAGTVTVTVGAGGAGGAEGENAGANGGTSSFGSLIVCGGGQGGEPPTGSFNPQNGGVVTTLGDLNIQGGSGSPRLPAPQAIMTGMGGGSMLGFGGTTLATLTAARRQGTDGGLAAGFGAGGTGGYRRTSDANGGAGTQGIVIVDLFV